MKKVTEEMKAAADKFFDIRTPPSVTIPTVSPYDAFIGGYEAALSASAEPGVGVKALEEAYAKGFEASGQGYNYEVFPEYEQDIDWLATRDGDLSALHKESGETLPPVDQLAGGDDA